MTHLNLKPPKAVALSTSFLKNLDFNDVIYAEFATPDAIDNAGKAFLLLLDDGQPICYRSDLFADYDVYLHLDRSLYADRHTAKNPWYDYYYGGRATMYL